MNSHERAGELQAEPSADSHNAWWKEAVVYQIYPRSFMDSDGDGIGDLQGIVSRLDYVKNLGVDVIWLNPIYDSPNDDNGYDIRNYRRIMADFGTMDDFDNLLAEVHFRGMKLVLDLVVNHTSDEHPWFVEARKSRLNPFYDFYHWWPIENGEPPRRKSFFDEEGNAWRYNFATMSYYLHYFSRKQPDLKWENPRVRHEIYELMRFWFDKGIDGFRMDSIPYISKDISYPEVDSRKYPDMFDYYSQGPHLHDYLREMNEQVTSRYAVMTVGEGSGVKPPDLHRFVEPSRRELNMLYTFEIPDLRKTTKPDAPDTGIDYSLLAVKKMFAELDRAAGDGWPAVYLGNHDQPRMVSRFGSDAPEHRENAAKMLATFLLTMRGTPFWLAGDEIGMSNIRFENIDDYNDIDTRNRYLQIRKEGGDPKAFLEEQKQTARDNARTPFQWDGSERAGFTTGVPWLKINPNRKRVNAEDEQNDHDSVLNYFKKAMRLRRSNRELIIGSFRLTDADNKQVFAYVRESNHERFLILLNFTPKEACATVDTDTTDAEVLLSNYSDRTRIEPSGPIALRPFEAIVCRLPPDAAPQTATL